MRLPARARIALALVVYATAIFGIIAPAIVSRAGAERVEAVILGATALLYASTTLLALWRKTDDPRVILFMFTGFAVMLTLVVPYHNLGARPALRDYAQLAIVCLVFLVFFAVVIHMTSLIPRRNPIVVRHPWMVWGAYPLGGVLAVIGFAEGPAVLRWLTIASYTLAGWVGLYLLASAAKHDETTEGRRQALVVFSGLLPWTINITSWLLFPRLVGNPVSGVIESVVILIVPVAILLSILRYRLFDVSVIVRRGLIYGGTTGLLTAAVFISGAILGELTGRVLGVRLTIWWLAALFFIAGAFFQPLAWRVGRRVDARFFREKVELRRLQQTIIPELANYTVGGAATDYLVQRVRETLALHCATLLLADEAQEFYRVRSADGELPGGASALGAVITSSELAAWTDLLAHGRPFLLPDRASEPEELRGAMRALGAQYVVPIRLSDLLVGLLLLGTSQKGWQLDGDDLDGLEVIAHQASAMLENARLLDLAVHDGLTRLPRAQYALEQMRGEVARSRRHFRPFAVAMIDIDDFKSINDSFGHQIGDAVLTGLVARLRAASRSIDLLARYGGDEFVLFLPDTPASGASLHVEQLRRAIEETELLAGDEPVRVTISAGLCTVGTAADLIEPTLLLKRADEALYAAKRAGRNRVEVWAGQVVTTRNPA